LDREDLLEVAGSAREVSGREARLGQVERELDVPLVQLRELLEQADAAVGVQREDRELRGTQALEKLLPVFSGEAGHDPVPPLEEAVLLLDRLHAVVHLGLPEVEDLLGADRAAALERLLQGQDPGMGHEEVLLEVPERLEERLDRVAGALDDVL